MPRLLIRAFVSLFLTLAVQAGRSSGRPSEWYGISDPPSADSQKTKPVIFALVCLPRFVQKLRSWRCISELVVRLGGTRFLNPGGRLEPN